MIQNLWLHRAPGPGDQSEFWAPSTGQRPPQDTFPQALPPWSCLGSLTGGLRGSAESPQQSFLQLCFLSSRGICYAPATLHTPLIPALENCRDLPGEAPGIPGPHTKPQKLCVLWGPGSKSARGPDRALAGHCPPGRDQTDNEPCFAGLTHTVGPAGPPRPVADMGHGHLPSASDSLPSTRHAGPNFSVLRGRRASLVSTTSRTLLGSDGGARGWSQERKTTTAVIQVAPFSFESGSSPLLCTTVSNGGSNPAVAENTGAPWSPCLRSEWMGSKANKMHLIYSPLKIKRAATLARSGSLIHRGGAHEW